MQSTGNFSCDPFKKMNQNKVIRGKFQCKGDAQNPKTKSGESGTSSGSGSSSSETSSGAAVVDNVANMPAMGMAAFFGYLLQFAM